jgi:AraC family transcriptional regulator
MLTATSQRLENAASGSGVGSVIGSDLATMRIDQELSASVAKAQLVRFHLHKEVEGRVHEDASFRLDLCLTPRIPNARGCFSGSWGSHRFEPIGELFVVPPGNDLRTRSDGGQQTSLVCLLAGDAIHDCIGGAIEWTDRRLESVLDVSSRQIRALLMRLAHEAHHPGFASELLVELIARQLAIELARYCQAAADSPVTGGLGPWRLRLIDERLMEVRKAPTLTELAALCKLSVRQLTRGFRESRGCSIGEYVARRRLSTAKRLLAQSESVKAVAYSMGFSSPSSFSSAFRRSTGFTPGGFRQQVCRS